MRVDGQRVGTSFLELQPVNWKHNKADLCEHIFRISREALPQSNGGALSRRCMLFADLSLYG